MKNAEDRILEYALELHFAPAPPMDLGEDIAQRWADGEQGSLEAWELEALVEDEESAAAFLQEYAGDRERAPRALLWRSLVWVAAGLLVALFGLQFWPKESPEPMPVVPQAGPWQVQLNEPLQILRAPERLAVAAKLIEAGDAVLVSEGEHDLDLGQGLSLHVSAPALFSLDRLAGELELSLFSGSVQVTSASGALLLANGVRMGSVLASAYRLKVPAWPDAEQEELDQLQSVGLLRRRHGADRELSLELIRGELKLSASSQEQALRPGEEVMLIAELGLLPAPAWAQAIEVVQQIMPLGAKRFAARTYWNLERAALQATELHSLLEAEPGLWVSLEHALSAPIEQGLLNPIYSSVLLDLFVFSDEAKALQGARRLWLAAPSAFNPRQIAALSSRGCFEFEREVIAQLDAWQEEPGSLESDPLFYAIAAAMLGDARGEDLLDKALRSDEDRGAKMGGFLLAAVGLEALGVSSAWEFAMDRVQELVERQLDDANLTDAEQLILRLELLSEHRADPESTPWMKALDYAGNLAFQKSDAILTRSLLQARLRDALAVH